MKYTQLTDKERYHIEYLIRDGHLFSTLLALLIVKFSIALSAAFLTFTGSFIPGNDSCICPEIRLSSSAISVGHSSLGRVRNQAA